MGPNYVRPTTDRMRVRVAALNGERKAIWSNTPT